MRRVGGLILWTVLAVGLGSCRLHPQESGRYAMVVGPGLGDGCGLVSGAQALGSGALSIAGDLIQLDLERFELRMVGLYQANVERFYLDGTAENQAIQIQGQDCLADQFRVHIEAQTETSTAFGGTFRIEVQSENRESCACVTTGEFSASKVQ